MLLSSSPRFACSRPFPRASHPVAQNWDVDVDVCERIFQTLPGKSAALCCAPAGRPVSTECARIFSGDEVPKSAGGSTICACTGVATNVVADYTLMYSAVDRSMNKAQDVSYHVKYQDTVPPNVAAAIPAHATLDACDCAANPSQSSLQVRSDACTTTGRTARDAVNGDVPMTSAVSYYADTSATFVSDFQTAGTSGCPPNGAAPKYASGITTGANVPGVYCTEYCAADDSGASACAVSFTTVNDPGDPTFALTDPHQGIECSATTTFLESAYTKIESKLWCLGSSQMSVTSTTPIDQIAHTPGKYEITFTAKHHAGYYTAPAQVTCKLTVDNYVGTVKYNNVVLTATSGDPNNWGSTKIYTFTEVSGARLDVQGRESGHGTTCQGTQCSGFAMECQELGGGAWDKFASTTDGSCKVSKVSDGTQYAPALTASSFSLTDSFGTGHEKIWGAGAAHNEWVLFSCKPASVGSKASSQTQKTQTVEVKDSKAPSWGANMCSGWDVQLSQDEARTNGVPAVPLPTGSDQCYGSLTAFLSPLSAQDEELSKGNAVGSYEELYTIADNAGNQATCTRKVAIVQPPTKAPTTAPSAAPTRAPTHHICDSTANPCDAQQGTCDKMSTQTATGSVTRTRRRLGDITRTCAEQSCKPFRGPNGGAFRWGGAYGQDKLKECEGDCDRDVDCDTGLFCSKDEDKGAHILTGCSGSYRRYGDFCVKKPGYTKPPTKVPTKAPTKTPTSHVHVALLGSALSAHAGTFQCGCQPGFECSDLTADPHCLQCKMTPAPTQSPTSAPTAPSPPTCTLGGNVDVKLERCSDVSAFTDEGATCVSGTAGDDATFTVQATSIELATAGKQVCSTSSKAEVVFVLDASGSVGSRNFKKVLETVKDIVQRLDIGDDGVRVGVLRYASKSGSNPQVSIELGTTNKKAELLTKIENIRYTGGLTYTANALQVTRADMFKNARAAVPKIVMVVTDGISTDGSQLAAKATELRAMVDPSGSGNDGIVYALGIATPYLSGLSKELGKIATPGYSQMIANFDVLAVTANVLVKMICTSSGGTTGAVVTSVATSDVGEFTLKYTAKNPIDATLVSTPVYRTVTIIDTTGPEWSSFKPVVELEASAPVTAKTTLALTGTLPTASNTCGSDAPLVQFQVSPAALENSDDPTTIYCGLDGTAGAAQAASVSAAATVAQDLSKLATVCGRYTVKWTATDIAGNKNEVAQGVYVRDSTAPNFS